jgi:hypothetical protein
VAARVFARHGARSAPREAYWFPVPSLRQPLTDGLVTTIEPIVLTA